VPLFAGAFNEGQPYCRAAFCSTVSSP
jgi:hypothetical protein